MILLAGLIAGSLTLAWGPQGTPTDPWREIRYAGRTTYTIVEQEGAPALAAFSEDRNSALVQELKLDPRGVELRWRWRVLEHPAGANPEHRDRDDRAAAVMVMVRRSIFPWRIRALLYQWTPARAKGEWSHSPYSREVRTLVLQNAAADSVWREEERDLAADLNRAFGYVPMRIEAIGVICDTDNTDARAAAEFGPIQIVRHLEAPR